MSDSGSKGPDAGAAATAKPVSAKEAERARLAAALRANLKRRKAQARARRDNETGRDGTAD